MNGKKLLLAVGLASLAGIASAAPYPSAATPEPADLGTARAVSGNESITVTVALPLRDTARLQALLQLTYSRGSAQFRHFLSPEEFNQRFGPAEASVEQVTRRLQSAGLQVTRASATLLKATGSTSAVESAFHVSLHTYQVPASTAGPGYRFRAPTSAPQLGSDMASVQAVIGLDTRPRFRPHLQHAEALRTPKVALSSAAPKTSDTPGNWTVVDFAQYYDVEPLYKAGLQGAHRTLGIVTLAAFTTSDVFNYWHSLALPVSSSRLKIVPVDGGSSGPSDLVGSDETTLDIEQAGGIAPAANMIVYEAPNSDQGLVDAFAAAVNANTADTVSTSWGRWEYLDETSTVTDPVTHKSSNALQALSDLFTQAALQGQSVYASAGDNGAYDANNPRGTTFLPFFSKVLSVDAPASLALVTAAGGTTLPGKQTFTLNDGSTYSVTIPAEQAWGWDYLNKLCSLEGTPDPVTCGTFPEGGGGGVSVYTPRPFYQYFVPGIINSATGQALYNETVTPPQLIAKLPGNYPGRNVPDVSLNADPDTGYTIYYTSNFVGFIIITAAGGTSFAAPQLNGVTALFDQGLGTRVGLLNPELYGLVGLDLAYGGKKAPLRDITSGDNWFYKGHAGYDQATGVGVPDFANFYNLLKSAEN